MVLTVNIGGSNELRGNELYFMLQPRNVRRLSLTHSGHAGRQIWAVRGLAALWKAADPLQFRSHRL